MKRISVIILILSGVPLVYALVPAPHVYAQEAKAGQAQPQYAIEDDTAAAKETEEGLVSLDFKDADLRDVLKVFSQQSGLNFVAARNIEDKKITLFMNEVMVEDALRTLMDANNLGLEQSPNSNILIVKGKPTPPIETKTRVYKIRYYFGNTSPGVYMDGSTSAKADSGSASGGQTGKGDAMGTGWANIIRPLLSEYGSVVTYATLLIVTDVPDRFKLIDQVISEVDRPVPEVMIEVELIETTADFLRNLGVKWSGEFSRFQGPATITAFPMSGQRSRTATGFTKLLTPLEGDGAFFKYGLLSSEAMTWIMNALQTDTNTKFLSKPRILVQDREWAEIKITSNQVVSVTTVVTETETKTEVERMEVGTILRLVPMINAEEGYISMLLEPKISRPTESSFTDTNGTSFIDPQERSMRSVVMAKDGETVAVGGFITTEDEETKTKVPWLGDVPVLGALFRHTSTNRVDKELLIFITPRIAKPSETVDVWAPQQAAAPQQPEPPEQKTASEQPGTGAAQPTAGKASETVKKDLAFREQEDITDLKLDLTVKGSNLGVVDLVK